MLVRHHETLQNFGGGLGCVRVEWNGRASGDKRCEGAFGAREGSREWK